MIIEYDENGRIFHIISDPIPKEMADAYKILDKTFIISSEPCDLLNDYILDGKIVNRPVFDFPEKMEIKADAKQKITLDLPDPCEIKIDNETYFIVGGKLDISSSMPAKYNIELLQWPYVQKTIEIEAK